MKKVRGSTLAKVLAIFLLLVMAVTFAASLLGVLFMVEFGFYNDSYSLDTILDDLGYNYLHRMAGHLQNILDDYETPPEGLLDFSVSPDFRYALYDENGKVLFDSLSEEELWSGTLTLSRKFEYRGMNGELFYYWSRGYGEALHEPASEPTPTDSVGAASSETVPTRDAADDSADTPTMDVGMGKRDSNEPEEDDSELQAMIAAGERQYTLVGGIPATLTPGGNAQRLLALAGWGYNMRYSAIGIGIGSLLLAIGLFVFLMCAAGHRDGTDTVTPNFADKLPFDLFFAAIGAGFALSVGFGIELIAYFGNIDSAEGILALCASLGLFVLAAVFFLWFCMSFATRLKLGTVIKSCLCYKIARWCLRIIWAVLCWCGRVLRAIFRALWKFLRSVSLMKKTVLLLLAILLAEFFWLALFHWNMGALLFGWFVERTALVLLVLYAVLCLRRLQRGAREIARGNEAFVVDTQYLHGDFKDAAEDLNSIQAGIGRAVNERMKSERFKTELITNVSHDIKTPLTSIINYVDLLGKEEPENEKSKEYIEVLSRQSARLKKLIEDLIEASKASTGNLSVNLERCDLNVLLDQTVGEYAEKLAAQELELVIQKPEQPIAVMADGRHTWRIFDNLMNNVCKYAQPGTRVYLNLEQKEGKAVVTFRNISRSQLNISGEELMERFVRGDSSRNTEGSGLGLSIARSLAQLQHSDLELTVDGDLFKVTLSFDIV